MVRIRIEDAASGIEFVVASMEPDAFGKCVTGLSCQSAKLHVRGLEYVSMRRITEKRHIYCPINTFDRKTLEAWLKSVAQEDGWLLDSSLGSQDSISTASPRDGVILRYGVTKYVDIQDGDEGEA